MSHKAIMRPLAVSMGDPAGIGPEVIVKAWLQRAAARVHPFVVCAACAPLVMAARQLGAELPVAIVDDATAAAEVFADALPVLAIDLGAEVLPGRPDAANGPAVVSAIRMAVDAVWDGTAQAVVTAPIAKRVLYSAGFTHPGHTEFLAALADARWPGRGWTPVMMLASAALRVVPVTIHIPLADVPGALTSEGLERTIRITVRALAEDFGIARPRLAVAGLNPHAGEGGAIGREDLDVIAPVVRRLAAEGLAVRGPLPADTLFHPAARATYDAVIAMYHDQALIPIKTIAFDDAVNVTLGLPFVRTSPDHGTAFDIAGRGVANPASFLAALQMASELGARRDAKRS